MLQRISQEWIQTDELQWVMRLSEDVFRVIDITRTPDEDCWITDIEVDISMYSDEALEKEVRGYYNSLALVKQTYGDDWKQIIAEIIAEQNTEDLVEFDKEESAKVYLRDKYQYHFK